MSQPLRTLVRRSLAVGLALAVTAIAAPSAMALNGGLDPDYGTGGRALAPGSGSFNASMRLTDGSVVAVGSTGTTPNRNAVAVKFTPAGALDTSFGVGGVVTIDAGGDDAALDIERRFGGTGFILSGTTDPIGMAGDGFTFKMNDSGVFDPTWGVGGIVFIADSPADRLVRVDQVQEVSGGDVLYAGVSNGDVTIVGRSDSAGVFTGGSFYDPPSDGGFPPDISLGLELRSDGDYSSISVYRSGTDSVVTMTTFDENGPLVSQAPIVFSTQTEFRSAQLLADDKWLITGSTEATAPDPQRGALWRIDETGVLDATFGTGGQFDLPTATTDFTATSLNFIAGGGAWVAGDLGTNQVRILKLNAALGLDTSFGTGGISDREFGASAPSRAVDISSTAGEIRPVVVGTLGTSAAAWRIALVDFAATTVGPVTWSATGLPQRLRPLTFNMSASNSGPDATRTTVTVTFPTSFEDVQFAPSVGTATVTAPGTGTWIIPSLAAGQTATMAMTVKPGEPGNQTVVTNVSQDAQRVGAAPSSQSATVFVYGAGTPRNDDITGTPGDDVIDALAGDDIVRAQAGNDIVEGGEGNDQLFGEDGNDIVCGGLGDDLIDGGNGNDKLCGDAGNDVLRGGAGNDVGEGGDGNDSIVGNDGNDTLAGGAGNDKVDGGFGIDNVDGGAGNDSVVGGAGNDTVGGGEGNDVVDSGDGNDVALGGTGNDLVYGRNGNDKIDGNDGNDKVFGGPGNDRVEGGAGADRVYGDTGNDYLIAQGDGDRLWGGPGNDRLDGNAGNDVINGGTGVDLINGKRGNDVLNGDQGNDWVNGSYGNDKIIGGNGRDLLVGGAGKDKIYAGADNDIIRLDDGFGGDWVDCGPGWDLVYANPGDIVKSNCEYVKYDVPRGTPFSRWTPTAAAYALSLTK